MQRYYCEADFDFRWAYGSCDRHLVALTRNCEYVREALLRIDPAIELPQKCGPKTDRLLFGHFDADQGLGLITAVWLCARDYCTDFPVRDPLARHVTPDWLSLPEAAFYSGLSINVPSLLVGGGQIHSERMAGVRGVPLQILRAPIDKLLERSKAGESISYRAAKRRCDTKHENHRKSEEAPQD